MARPRNFDETRVVDNAIKAFIEDGPSGASLEKLELVTGVGRKSLYNTFGDKHGLLIRAVEKFQYDSIRNYVEPLEARGAGRPEIERVVMQLAEDMADKKCSSGCLLFLSAQDTRLASKQIDLLVKDYFERLRKGFLKCIKRGVSRGEITSTMSPPALADFFIGVFVGVSSMSRSGITDNAITSFVEVSLQELR